MKFLKKIKLIIAVAIVGLNLASAGVAFAQTRNFDIPTALPVSDENIGGTGDACVGLATMIRTGNITLRSIPCFIKFFSQTLVGLAGTLSVLFIMIGGYRYVIGEDEINQGQAKKTITYAIIGLVVSLLAWVIIGLALQVSTE